MRTNLFATLAGVLLVAGVGTSAADRTAAQKLGREIFQELIETDTTHSTGDTTKAAEALARRFLAGGFPAADVQVLGPQASNRNLVVRYRGRAVGTNSPPPVLLLAHLDVVEAKREDWSLDPFKLTERDGYFYGRGTSDDKDGAAQLTTALLRLRAEQFEPNRDVVLALTAGEEGGAENGARWLLQNHRELVAAGFCLNADSGGLEERKGKRTLYAVQAAEKTYLSFRLEARGPGGHSSLPTHDNPIYRLSEGLVQLSRYQFAPRLNEITRGYFEKTARIETGQTALDMKAVLGERPDSEVVERLSANPFFNALLRTTAAATLIEGGHAENALPQTARATVNCRLVPGESPADVEAALRRMMIEHRVTVTALEPAHPSPASPLTPEVMRAIEGVVARLWPGLPVVPVMETGATDGLFFRQAGIPTYGVGGTGGDVDDVRAHGKDERVAVENFYHGLEFEFQLIRAVTSAP